MEEVEEEEDNDDAGNFRGWTQTIFIQNRGGIPIELLLGRGAVEMLPPPRRRAILKETCCATSTKARE